MKPTLDDLRMAAYRAGYEIKSYDFEDDRLGVCDSTARIIYIAEGLTGRKLRSTLAHETVHARLEHTGPRHDRGQEPWRGADEPWLDDAVDVLAAGVLFSEQDFLAAREQARAVRRQPTYKDIARRLGTDSAMLWQWYAARKVYRGEVTWLPDSEKPI